MLMFKGRLVKNLEIDGVDYNDHPDYCDAYFSYAEYENGTALTDAELETLTEIHSSVVNEMAHDRMMDEACDFFDMMED